jgi:hypothetical protein
MTITGTEIQQRLSTAPAWHGITIQIRDTVNQWTIPDQDSQDPDAVNNLTTWCCELLVNVNAVQRQTVWNFLRRWALPESDTVTASDTGITLNCYLQD